MFPLGIWISTASPNPARQCPSPINSAPQAMESDPAPEIESAIAPPSLPLTLLMLIAPALVMACFAVLPREAINSSVGTGIVLMNTLLGPAIAGWGAGGRLALRSRLIPEARQQSSAVLRLLCIVASYVLSFFGCAATMAANMNR